MTTNKPRVIMHSIASVDGRLTTAPGVLLLYGDERWQNAAGDDSGVYIKLMATYQPQATLEGSGSMVVEGAQPEPLPPFEGDPAALYADFLPESVVSVPGRKWFTVVDGRGRARNWMKQYPGEEWADWYLLVLVCRQTPAAYLAYLRREMIPYLLTGEEHVDLAGALAKMRGKLGVETLVSTAGGRLNRALMRAGLVDEVSLEFFPAFIGGSDTPALGDGPALGPDEQPVRLALRDVQTAESGRVWLRYDVRRD